MDIPKALRWQVCEKFGLSVSFGKFLARLENTNFQKLAILASFHYVVKNGAGGTFALILERCTAFIQHSYLLDRLLYGQTSSTSLPHPIQYGGAREALRSRCLGNSSRALR